MDLFVVPTISFRLLYGLPILQHSRRELVWLGVTARPSAHWIARQLTEAYGWHPTPQYIARDRDCVYGDVVIQRLRAMGIRDRPISPRSPWQNGYSERLIGSIRQDSLGRTYHRTRTRRYRVPFRPSVAHWRGQFWADCTTNISERKFPTGTTAAIAVVCSDPQSVGGVAGSTDGRGIPVEHGAHLFGARQ